MMNDEDPWEVLGVSHGCEFVEVKKAFRRLAIKCHPDKKCCSHLLSYEEMTQRFQSILHAFEILRIFFLKGTPPKLMHQQSDLVEASSTVSINELQKLDANLFCYVCRCGEEIGFEVNPLEVYTPI